MLSWQSANNLVTVFQLTPYGHMDESEHKITQALKHPLPKHWSIQSLAVVLRKCSVQTTERAQWYLGINLWYAHVRWNVWQAHKLLTEQHINNWWNSSSHISCHLHRVCILISNTKGVPSNMTFECMPWSQMFFLSLQKEQQGTNCPWEFMSSLAEWHQYQPTQW